MDFLSKYPNSKLRFFGWLLEMYGASEDYFFGAPFEQQHRTVWDFLGQPIPDIMGWRAEKIEQLSEDYLYDFEDVIMRYPYGMKDPLKEIRKLDYSEIPAMYPDAHIPKEILPGLCNAMVERTTSYDMKIEFMTSLNEALVDLDSPIEPIINDKTFWDEIIKEVKSPQHEDAPF